MTTLTTESLFSGKILFIIRTAKLSDKYCQILEKLVIKRSGKILKIWDDSVTHIIASSYTSYELQKSKIWTDKKPNNHFLVNPNWISESVALGKLQIESDFPVEKKEEFKELEPIKETKKRKSKIVWATDHDNTKATKMQKTSNSFELRLDHDEQEKADPCFKDVIIVPSNWLSSTLLPGDDLKLRSKFACQKSPSENNNKNSNITDILNRLSGVCQSCGQDWQSKAYKKAANIIANLKFKIESVDQINGILGIGESIREKIKEILATGHLRKEISFKNDPNIQFFQSCSKIFGVGTKTIQKWIVLGFKTIDDVREKADLTVQQKIGLQYYDEFQKRIPRLEVEQVETLIKAEIQKIDSNLSITICGSYRRGKKDCGDIDVLVTGSEYFDITKLIKALHLCKFLTDDLSISSGSNTYMGVYMIEEIGIHRRIDIRFYTSDQFPCALLYFTGSAHFNRSMRLYANKKGYSLTDKSLTIVYSSSFESKPIPVSSESDIFKELKLEYKSPEERDV